MDAAAPRAFIRFSRAAGSDLSTPPAAADGTAGASDDRFCRRMNESAAAAVPLFLAAVAAALVDLFLGPEDLPQRSAWLAAMMTIEIGGVAAAVIAALRMSRAAWRRGARTAVVVSCILLLVAIACYPLVFDVAGSPAERMAFLSVGVAALGGCLAFAGSHRLTWTPLLVPTAWLMIAFASKRGTPGAGELVVPSLVLAIAMVVTTWALFEARTRTTRAALAGEDRLQQMMVARDSALKDDRDKSRFLAIATHDLRQPLHALGLFAAALENRLRGTENEHVVQDMVQSIDGLNRSFNAIMDVSQLDAGAIEPSPQRFPLRDVFRRLHMHFAGQAELAALALRFSPGGKSVTSDPQLLERILGNLIQNALKYTVDGGVVVVARTTNRHVNVEVWDTGVGIPAGELPLIFQEFYQIGQHDRVRMRGLGMGLAIVKRLADLLDHDLTVASIPGRGSMFRLSIPRGDPSDIEDFTVAADTIPMPSSRQRTALIVDDDEAIRNGLGLLLTEWGYQSVGAADAEQARYVLRLLESVPDVLLCDLHLGDGPSGIAAIRAIRRQCGRDVPAVLITGDPAVDEIARAAGSELLVLSKPVQPRLLRNALRSFEETG